MMKNRADGGFAVCSRDGDDFHLFVGTAEEFTAKHGIRLSRIFHDGTVFTKLFFADNKHSTV